MKELRKNVFACLEKYVDAYLEVKKEVLKTGKWDDDVMHKTLAQVNTLLNQKFDEAEERMSGAKKKGGFFG